MAAQPALGRRADPRRTAQAWHPGLEAHRSTVHGTLLASRRGLKLGCTTLAAERWPAIKSLQSERIRCESWLRRPGGATSFSAIDEVEFAVVGAGVVGLAVARALAAQGRGRFGARLTRLHGLKHLRSPEWTGLAWYSSPRATSPQQKGARDAVRSEPERETVRCCRARPAPPFRRPCDRRPPGDSTPRPPSIPRAGSSYAGRIGRFHRRGVEQFAPPLRFGRRSVRSESASAPNAPAEAPTLDGET
jgi:hypothetical protein